MSARASGTGLGAVISDTSPPSTNVHRLSGRIHTKRATDSRSSSPTSTFIPVNGGVDEGQGDGTPSNQLTFITLDSPNTGPRMLTPTPIGSKKHNNINTSVDSSIDLTKVTHQPNSPNNKGKPSNSRSPSTSPRPARSPTRPHVGRGISILSASRAASTLGTGGITNPARPGYHGVVDWKPYDPGMIGRNNVETILSPELEARKEEVARRKAEALKAERARFVQARVDNTNPTTTPTMPRPPPINTQLTPGQQASPNSPPHSTPLSAGSSNSIPTPTTATTTTTSTSNKARPAHLRHLPNAHTSAQHDLGHEIFGSSKDNHLYPPSLHAHAPVAPHKKHHGSTMASGRVFLPGDKRRPPKSSTSNGQTSSNERTYIREVRVRTRGFECGWQDRDSNHTPSPPPPGAAWLYQVIEHSPIYIWFSIILTIFSLFARDFSIAFLPKVLDDSLNGLLIAAMALFTIELCANIYCKENYFLWSFLFYLDLIGTFSLCFDIDWINDEWFPSTDSSSSVSRSTTILRLTKFARILRILKLIRIVRVFKLQKTFQRSSLRTNTPSKVGLTLSELQDKKVIGMLMIILIIFPFFFVSSSNDDTSAAMGLEMIGVTAQTGNMTLIQQQVQMYIDIQEDRSDVLAMMIRINGIMIPFVQDKSDELNDLRSNEYELHELNPPLGSGYALFSRRHDVQIEAIYTFSFTLAVIIIFSVGSFLLSRDVKILVVDPLDRMTAMVKRLAGTILFLNHPVGGSDNDPSGGGIGGVGGRMHTHGLRGIDDSLADASAPGEFGAFETEAIEEVIAQMANIFAIEKDETPGMPKSLAMLSGSKHTQIRTLNSVVQIDVSERPRQLGEDGDLDGDTHHVTGIGGGIFTFDNIGQNNDGGAPGGGGGDTTSSIGIGIGGEHHSITLQPILSIHDFPECCSIDSILHHPTLLPYFKLFLTSSLTLENLLFVQEVDRFRTIMKLHVLNLYNAFISPKAPNQVNLPSVQRSNILSELENPSVTIFDESQSECITLMSGFLKQFQSSKYCQGYMKRYAARMQHGTFNAHLKKMEQRSNMTHAAPRLTQIQTIRQERREQASPKNVNTMKTNTDHTNVESNLTHNTTDLITIDKGDASKLLSPSGVGGGVNGRTLRHSSGVGGGVVGNESPPPPSPSPEVFLPGSVESHEEPTSDDNNQHRRTSGGAAKTIAIAGVSKGVSEIVAQAKKRSSGRASGTAISDGVLISETDLNQQIAALIASEGPMKLRASYDPANPHPATGVRRSHTRTGDAAIAAALKQTKIVIADQPAPAQNIIAQTTTTTTMTPNVASTSHATSTPSPQP